MTDAVRVHGALINEDGRKDSLIRVSLKAVILNDKGQVLVVKERGRDWWDIPGGGIEHGEAIEGALSRELQEEVLLKGGFDFETILAKDPRYNITHNLYQMRITFLVKPKIMSFEPGEDGDEIKFIDPAVYENSDLITERKIFEYSQLARTRSASP